MEENNISQRDYIIVSAIELISDSGLSALSMKHLSYRSNISETMIYKLFGGIGEVLVAVVETFVKFDKSIRQTVLSKDASSVSKIKDFFNAYATYYENYKEITAVILNYEELLHNADTRELVTNCIQDRDEVLRQLIKEGLERSEIKDIFTTEELSDILISVMNGMILSRRVIQYEKSLKAEMLETVEKLMKLIAVVP